MFVRMDELASPCEAMQANDHILATTPCVHSSPNRLSSTAMADFQSGVVRFRQ
jgi:hypothetical protein